MCDDTSTARMKKKKKVNRHAAWELNTESKKRKKGDGDKGFLMNSSKFSDPSPGRSRGRLECSHGNRASLSPFWGTGGVAGGDAGLHAV